MQLQGPDSPMLLSFFVISRGRRDSDKVPSTPGLVFDIVTSDITVTLAYIYDFLVLEAIATYASHLTPICSE